MVVVVVVVMLALVAACDHSEFGAVVLGSTGRSADVRPDFDWNQQPVEMMGYR
jgi:hypothetical protein